MSSRVAAMCTRSASRCQRPHNSPGPISVTAIAHTRSAWAGVSVWPAPPPRPPPGDRVGPAAGAPSCRRRGAAGYVWLDMPRKSQSPPRLPWVFRGRCARTGSNRRWHPAKLPSGPPNPFSTRAFLPCSRTGREWGPLPFRQTQYGAPALGHLILPSTSLHDSHCFLDA
jgi:hypothetical protein